MDTVVEYYTGYDEEGRLARHRTEFVATTYLLSKWMVPGSSILDVGAGTGIYSLYLASRGHDLTAVDIVPKHVSAIRSKVPSGKDLKVSAFLGDARDLSRFRDAEFDAVLCRKPGERCSLAGGRKDRPYGASINPVVFLQTWGRQEQRS